MKKNIFESGFKHKNKLNVVQKPVNASPSFGGAAVWLSGITLCVTLLSITFYGAGKAYRVAYLHQFGVTDSMLPWSTQDLIYLGIVKQLDTLFFAYPALAGFLLVMILFMWVSYKAGKFLRGKFSLKASKKTSKNPDLDAPYIETAFLLLIMLTGFVLFILGFAFLLYVAQAEKIGKTEGLNDRKLILKGDEISLKKNGVLLGTFKASIEDKSNSTTAYFFSCSDKACLSLEKTTEKIFYVPLDKAIGFSPTPPTIIN